MGRREYLDDPDAPPANSLIPAASAVVVDDQGRVLLHRRRDNNLWSVPGGAMEPGESISQTVVREVKEETGLDVKPRRIIGVYSNPHHVVAYDDGEVRQQFSVCFACDLVGGTLEAENDESLEVGFFTREQIATIDMTASIRRRIDDYFADPSAATFD